MFKNARLVKSGFPALTLQEEQVIGFFGISFSENQGYCEAGSMMLLQKKCCPVYFEYLIYLTYC